MAVPFTTAKSGQPFKKNSGVILAVSSVHDAPAVGITPQSNVSFSQQYGWNPNIPTGVANSGNLGLQKIFASRIITQSPYTQSAPNFLAMGLPHSIAGVASNILLSTAPDHGQRHAVNRFYAYQRLNITGWSYVTGAATKGSANGASVLASGLDGTTGVKADQAPYI